MQQTTQYQLNLIETDDAFSPNPLNDNAQKLEAALQAAEAAQAAEAQAREEADSALDQRLAVIEGVKMASGYYSGTEEAHIINVGFHPQLVLISSETETGFLTRSVNETDGTAHFTAVKIVDDGFHLIRSRFNRENGYYHYFAIG